MAEDAATQAMGCWNGVALDRYPQRAMEELSIAQFLAGLDLQDHTNALMSEGFHMLSDLVAVKDELSDGDLQSMGLHRMMDRKKLLKAVHGISADKPNPSPDRESAGPPRTRVLGLAINRMNEQNQQLNDRRASEGVNCTGDDPFAPGYGYDPFKSPSLPERAVQWERVVETIEADVSEALDAHGFDSSPYMRNNPKGTRARAVAYDALRRGRPSIKPNIKKHADPATPVYDAVRHMPSTNKESAVVKEAINLFHRC